LILKLIEGGSASFHAVGSNALHERVRTFRRGGRCSVTGVARRLASNSTTDEPARSAHCPAGMVRSKNWLALFARLPLSGPNHVRIVLSSPVGVHIVQGIE
jgi:hypothetical protein